MLLRQCAVVPAIMLSKQRVVAQWMTFPSQSTSLAMIAVCRIGIQSVERPTQVDLGKVQLPLSPMNYLRGNEKLC